VSQLALCPRVDPKQTDDANHDGRAGFHRRRLRAQHHYTKARKNYIVNTRVNNIQDNSHTHHPHATNNAQEGVRGARSPLWLNKESVSFDSASLSSDGNGIVASLGAEVRTNASDVGAPSAFTKTALEGKAYGDVGDNAPASPAASAKSKFLREAGAALLAAVGVAGTLALALASDNRLTSGVLCCDDCGVSKSSINSPKAPPWNLSRISSLRGFLTVCHCTRRPKRLGAIKIYCHNDPCNEM
jgi:hypothetical protein